MPPHLKRIGDWMFGLGLGAVAAWLLFGNPPTGALVAIIVVAAAIAWLPRLGAARKRQRRDD